LHQSVRLEAVEPTALEAVFGKATMVRATVKALVAKTTFTEFVATKALVGEMPVMPKMPRTIGMAKRTVAAMKTMLAEIAVPNFAHQRIRISGKDSSFDSRHAVNGGCLRRGCGKCTSQADDSDRNIA